MKKNKQVEKEGFNFILYEGNIYMDDGLSTIRLTAGAKLTSLQVLVETDDRIYFQENNTRYYYFDKKEKVIIFIDDEVGELFLANNFLIPKDKWTLHLYDMKTDTRITKTYENGKITTTYHKPSTKWYWLYAIPIVILVIAMIINGILIS